MRLSCPQLLQPGNQRNRKIEIPVGDLVSERSCSHPRDDGNQQTRSERIRIVSLGVSRAQDATEIQQHAGSQDETSRREKLQVDVVRLCNDLETDSVERTFEKIGHSLLRER